MTLTEIAASLTGEGSLAKDTGGRGRPSRDEIARLAYYFFETRGRRHGHDVDDWMSAERELTHRYRKTTVKSSFISAFVAVRRASSGRRRLITHRTTRQKNGR